MTSSPNRSFFDDILEPLFYDALAREHDDNFVPHFNRRVPFLNGGLFEAIGGYDWVNVDIPLKNELFTDIFNTFDLYNFTVREDEPLDKEVAVDPEMLGKVFENLLDVTDRKSKGAFYTPREIVHYMCQESLINYLDTALNTVTRPMAQQTPTQDDLFGRLQTRQVPLTEDVYEERVLRADIEYFVRFFEQLRESERTYNLAKAAVERGEQKTTSHESRVPESVKQHAAAIDEALADIRICDPAIGSGAFPVGMMNEIVRARETLNEVNAAFYGAPERNPYDFKRHAIQESIYGVDIEESAVDIAKLRLWLSLIVDEDDFGTIKPLPNLEYKIVIGNSLLGVEETLFNNEAFETLARLQHDYIGETRPGQKRSLKGRIDALIGGLTNDSERFDFKIYFSEVFRQKGGFDVVIANPPYVGQKGNKEIFQKIARTTFGRKFHQRRMDLFYFFFHLALDVLKPKGIAAFITTNYYLTATYADKLRADIRKRTVILKLLNFNELKIFDSATGQHNMITILVRDNNEQKLASTAVTDRKGVLESENFNPLLHGSDEQTRYFSVEQRNIFEGSELYIRISGKSGTGLTSVNQILGKMVENSIELANFADINQGIVTGADKVSDKHLATYDLEAEKGQGIFVLGEEEVNNLSLNGEELKLLKPWFKNSDISKWHTNKKASKNLLYVTSSNNRVVTENLIRHFETFKPVLINRNVRAGRVTENEYNSFTRNQLDISYVMIASQMKAGCYYCISYARREDIFTSEKIVAPQRSYSNTFGYNSIPWFASADVYFITSKSVARRIQLRYLLGLLNSKLYYFWLYHRGKRKGNMLELYKKPLSEIPIRTINFSDPADKQKHDAVVGLVETMLSLHEQKAVADPSERARLEGEIAAADAQIDRLVYGLYELTEEEIRIVEEAVKA